MNKLLGLGISVLFIFVSITQLCFVTTSPQCLPNGPDGPFPSPYNCSFFIRCEKYGDLIEDTPINCDVDNCCGNHFSEDLRKCVHPDKALCLPVLRNLTCVSFNERLSHPTNCSRFFVCDDALRPIVDDCPVDQHFSSELKECVSKRDANCDPMYCDEMDNPDRPTLLPDPSNCAAFFKCHNGRPMPMLCPSNLYFSVESKRCEFPFYVNCKAGVRTKS